MTKSPRVLILNAKLDRGGIGSWMLRHVPVIRGKGLPVQVAYLTGEGTLADEFRAQDVKVNQVRHDPSRFVSTVKQVDRLIRREGIDVVQSNNALDRVIVSVAKAIYRTPVSHVSLVHTTREPIRFWKGDHGLAKRFGVRSNVGDWFVRSYTQAFLAVSDAVAHAARQRFRVPVTVCYPGMHRPRERDGSEAGHYFLAIGRLHRVKRYSLLIEALSRCDASIHARLAGIGPLENELRTLADHIGVADRIDFLGYVDDVGEALSHALGLVITSEREGLPQVAIEALGHGVPLVMADIPVARELVHPGVNGFISPADPQSLATYMERIALNERLRETLSYGARRSFSRMFDMDKAVERLISAYCQAAAFGPTSTSQ